MQKFIFRNPFVTKRDKKRAYQHLSMALVFCDAACRDQEINEGIITDFHVMMLQKSSEEWCKAAKLLGFRNITDMNEWVKERGSL